MYIKNNEVIRAHCGIMLNGVSDNLNKDYNSLTNNLDFEPCNIASFSEQITTNKYRTTKYHTVLEDEECVILTYDNGGLFNPVGLVFRASKFKKYLMKTTISGKIVTLQEYISTVIPYSLGDASGSTYVNSIQSYWYDPSAVAVKTAGSSNNLLTYTGGDGTTGQYDWYDETTCLEDYIIFSLYNDGFSETNPYADAVFDIGFLTTDMANIDGIYNIPNIKKINEF